MEWNGMMIRHSMMGLSVMRCDRRVWKLSRQLLCPRSRRDSTVHPPAPTELKQERCGMEWKMEWNGMEWNKTMGH